jgi:hypothetical protein
LLFYSQFLNEAHLGQSLFSMLVATWSPPRNYQQLKSAGNVSLGWGEKPIPIFADHVAAHESVLGN